MLKRHLPRIMIGGGILALVIFFGDFFVPAKGFLIGAVNRIIRAPLEAVAGEGGNDLLTALTLENAKLKAEILFLSKQAHPVTSGERNSIVAKIFTSYPFTNRGLITINAGSNDGIKKGLAVTSDGYTFLGVIDEVGPTYSVVRTVFDPGWELPVKIGSDSANALLVGGRDPRLTLIVKGGDLSEGDSVYTASTDFPYGLNIGELSSLSADAGSAFREGRIVISQTMRDLSEVSVLLR